MKRLLGLASAFCLVTTIASAQDVSYNFDQKADFSKYKTYKWVTVKDAEQPDQLVAQADQRRHREAARDQGAHQDRQRHGRSLRGVPGGRDQGEGSDVLEHRVRHGSWLGRALVRRVLRRRDDDHHDPRRSTSGPWRSTCTSRRASSWSGGAWPRSRSTPRRSPEKRQKNLDKGMAKMFKNYPPKVKK